MKLYVIAQPKRPNLHVGYVTHANNLPPIHWVECLTMDECIKIKTNMLATKKYKSIEIKSRKPKRKGAQQYSATSFL